MLAPWAIWLLQADVAAGLPDTSVPLWAIGAITVPLIGALTAGVKWLMKQIEELRAELTEAYKVTIPAVQQCLATQQQSLASQREMIDVTRSMADLLAQERNRQGRR